MKLAQLSLLVFSMPLSGAWAANTPLPIPANASGAPLGPVDLGSVANDLRGVESVGDAQIAGSLLEHLTGATPPDPLLPLMVSGVAEQNFALPLAQAYLAAHAAGGAKGVAQMDARLLALVHEPVRAQVLPAPGEEGPPAVQDLAQSVQALRSAPPEAQRAFVRDLRLVLQAVRDGTLQNLIDGIHGARQEAPPVPEGAAGYRRVVDDITAGPAQLGSWASAEDVGPRYAIQMHRALTAATRGGWRLIEGGGRESRHVFLAREESLGTDAETIVDPNYLRYFDEPATLGEPQVFVGTRVELIEVFNRHRNRISRRFMEGNVLGYRAPMEFVELHYGFASYAARRRDVTARLAEEPVGEAPVAAEEAPHPAPAAQPRDVTDVDMRPANPGNPLRSLAVDGTIEIGREPSGEGALQVNNTRVSRHHATIKRTAAGYLITDLQSRQGVYFQPERLVWERFTGSREFPFGGAVRLGGVDGFAFVLPDPNLPPAERPEDAPSPPEIVPARLVSYAELLGEHPGNPFLALGLGRAVEIGRDPQREGALRMGLDHRAVSRRHATVERTEQGYLIADIGSEQGTYFLDEDGDWQRLTEPHLFRPGEAARLGGSEGFTFFLPGAPPIRIARPTPVPDRELLAGHPRNPFLGLELGRAVEIGNRPRGEVALQMGVGRDAVSPRHATIERTAEGYRITELESTQGVYFLDQAGDWQRLAEPRVLRPGEAVRLGAEGGLAFVLPSLPGGAPIEPSEAVLRSFPTARARVVLAADLVPTNAGNPFLALEPGRSVEFGREPHGAGALEVDSPGTTRRHARIERTAEGWRVEDMGSLNGTHFLNRDGIWERLTGPREFHPGEALRFGNEGDPAIVLPVAVSPRGDPVPAPVEARIRDLNANGARNPLSRLAPGETALIGRKGTGGAADIQVLDAPAGTGRAHIQVTRTQAGFFVENLREISFVNSFGNRLTVGRFQLFYPGDRIVLADGRDFVTFPGAASRAPWGLGWLYYLLGRG